LIWVCGEAIYFLQKGWTEKSRMKVICPSGKSLRASEFRIASIVPRIEA
jgi:hypothetical protein